MGCGGKVFNIRGHCRSASKVASDKSYVKNPEARGPTFGIFGNVIFYGSSSGRIVVQIGYFCSKFPLLKRSNSYCAYMFACFLLDIPILHQCLYI